MTADRFFIISIDGGGIRGVLPSLLLQTLGDELLARADLLAGTSTGSIIALNLAAGVPIRQITDVYRTPASCSRIFKPWLQRSSEQAAAHASLWERMKQAVHREEAKLLESGPFSVLEELVHPMYTNEGLREVLLEQGPPKRINELRPFVMAPTFLLDGGDAEHPEWHATAVHNLPPHVAHTASGDGRHHHRGFGEMTVVQAIMASAAAPVYFPPLQHGERLFVDGGMFANNPAMMAFIGALNAGLIGSHPGAVPLDKVTLLSLGTGANTNGYPPVSDAFPPPFGLLGWMWPKSRHPGAPGMPLMQLQSDAASQMVDHQLRVLLPADSYRRVQIDLGERPIALNDISRVPELEQMAADCIASAHWREVRAWLAQRLA